MGVQYQQVNNSNTEPRKGEAMTQDKFDVGGMTCAACQAHVDRAVSKLDGVQSELCLVVRLD